jgi:hypothetical protein
MSRLCDEIVKELMMSPMKSVFTFSRDELVELMFGKLYRGEGLMGAYSDIVKLEALEKENPGIAPGRILSRKERNN